MDRTEGVETLKKELFEIKLSRAMRQGSIADRVELVKREEKVNKIVIGYNKGLKQKGIKNEVLTNKEKAK